MTTTAPAAATERWLTAAPFLPRPLDPDAAIADRLILLLHYGVDRSERNWLSARSGDYYWNQYLPAADPRRRLHQRREPEPVVDEGIRASGIHAQDSGAGN